MSIPLATTAITIYGYRPRSDVDPDADGYDTPREPPSIVIAGVAACISGPSRLNIDGAEIEVWRMRADLCDLFKHDHVLDESTGITYLVSTVAHSRVTMFNLDHTMADLTVVDGLPTEGGSGYDS